MKIISFFLFVLKVFKNFKFSDFLKYFLFFKLKNKESIKFSFLKENFFFRNTNSSDKKVFDQVFIQKEYNFDFKIIPQVIVDLGANIGCFSIYIKEKYPNSMLISVEPDISNFEILKKNTKNYNNIYLENSGVWNKKTILQTNDLYDLGNWGIVTKESEFGNISITMDEIFEKYNLQKIDILKIDIETSELELFKSNYNLWLPKVKIIIIELHDWLKPGCSQSFFKAITNSFENFSFSQLGENIIIYNENL